MKKIRRILLANRGEVVVRIARTLKTMGIPSIAVFTSEEKNALHVRVCDEKVQLPGKGVSAYLNVENMIDAAKRAKADAVHPGFGFLSENVTFAKACGDAGLKFIGPKTDSIEQMGDKENAKALARKLGIPTLESLGEDQFGRATFPLLLKPLAGGGGKGMVPVFQRTELKEAISRAKAEAKNAFGDERLLVEPYLDRARHVEVQVAADQYGNVTHLFERDCTFQRRHQKIIEESPSPFLKELQRNELFAAAEKITRAVGYWNLGTVEFILDANGKFYFMEMNTRLQVEHPVTEERCGIDLVRAQVLIAQGETLSRAIPKPKPSGHVIEARIYAEDPENQFLPATGKILELKFPSSARIESGIEEGMSISSDFDPMLAKIIIKGKDRKAATANMLKALSTLRILGLVHNVNYLQWLLRRKEFRESTHHTTWILKNHELFMDDQKEKDAELAVVLALAAQTVSANESSNNDDEWVNDPWLTMGDWRLGVVG